MKEVGECGGVKFDHDLIELVERAGGERRRGGGEERWERGASQARSKVPAGQLQALDQPHSPAHRRSASRRGEANATEGGSEAIAAQGGQENGAV